jgi:hypothetical protein
VNIYVEGGGNSKELRVECRRGFFEFLKKADLAGNMPRIVACGTRADAYDSFKTAIAAGKESMLLVDSEAPVSDDCQCGDAENWRPWVHLKTYDSWDRPAKARDADCHLMTQCMEAWFIADRAVLEKFFGQGFNAGQLSVISAGKPLEKIPKKEIYTGLKKASQHCKTKYPYGKGAHSFKILALIDPQKIMGESPWAKRFVDKLNRKA